ncbi:hypothetical protein LCGC14_0659840 [marine sediment metagenome]|uniref:Uncharacterized protein n=1 Tax=marine sediment metagenome TaxID=412755 RepID=A0A0F9QTW8_9ZZZZ
MRPYRKNFKPKNRQEVAGGNDHCWIPETQKYGSKEDKKKYDESYVRIFGHE